MRLYEPTTAYDHMYFRRMRGKRGKVRRYLARQAKGDRWANLMPRKPLGNRCALRTR